MQSTDTRPVSRTAVSDFGAYPTVDQRRDALLELAEAVANEQGRVCRPISLVLPLIVPSLAAAAVSNVLAEFDDLVDAVTVRSRFVADPDEWLARHDLPLSSAVYEAQDEATEQQVDQCLDALMGKRSAVRR